MAFKITADQAREVAAGVRVPYPPEEVYNRIRELAEMGFTQAIFNSDRWSNELTGMLSKDGYSLWFVPRDGAVYVTWGKEPRKLMEGGNDHE